MKNTLIILAVLATGIGTGYLISTNKTTTSCTAEERQIRQAYADYTRQHGHTEILQALITARMYEELAENGCANNREDYATRAADYMARVNAAISAEHAANVEMVVIDMQEIANTVNEITRDMADAIGTFIDRMRNTRINVTVEQR